MKHNQSIDAVFVCFSFFSFFFFSLHAECPTNRSESTAAITSGTDATRSVEASSVEKGLGGMYYNLLKRIHNCHFVLKCNLPRLIFELEEKPCHVK